MYLIAVYCYYTETSDKLVNKPVCWRELDDVTLCFEVFVVMTTCALSSYIFSLLLLSLFRLNHEFNVLGWNFRPWLASKWEAHVYLNRHIAQQRKFLRDIMKLQLFLPTRV